MFICKILQRRTVPTIFILLMFFLKLGAHPVCAQNAAQDGGVKTRTIEIPFTSYDGYEMFGKLTIPTSGQSHPVVIYVQTAEGMTVDTKRQKSRDANLQLF
jgi:hypothetical protein